MYPRKFIANERSLPKQANKVSYQQLPIKHVADNQFKNPYYSQFSSKKLQHKDYSDSQVRPKQQYFKNLNQRRKNDGQMSSLKTELQNLKNEVNKLINKQPGTRTPKKQRQLLHQDKSDKKINYVNKRFQDQYQNQADDFNDTASMSSVTTQKVLNEPLRKLQIKASSQHYDHDYYMKLQNDLLKTQIKNLKNKYVSKKRELVEKCQLLQKKIQFLQVSLQKSEQSLVQCRKALQMQIIIIKKQISQKSQVKHQIQIPSSDKIDIQGNDLLKDKVKRLYDQLNEKTKQINNLNIEVGDLEAMLDRKKFDLKKQTQKSSELSKQIQFNKRQFSRTQQYLQTEIGRKKQLQKQNQTLKQKNQNLMNQLYTKEQIVTGSEQYETRLSQQIQEYKKKEDELHQKLTSLREQNKRYKQLSQSDKDQINYLRKNNEETMSKINQLSKRLKEEQQKWLDREDYYRKLIDQNKKKQQEKIKIIREEYQSVAVAINMEKSKKQEQIYGESSDLIREKDRQINKWKAQYKILKLKHEEKNSSQTRKKEEIDQYYRGYVEYKHQNQLLNERIKLLQKSIEKYVQKISQKQAQLMRKQVQFNKNIERQVAQITVLQREINAAKEESFQLKNKQAEITLKLEQETKYRQQVQTKIQRFIQKQLYPQKFQESDEDSELQEEGYGQELVEQLKKKNIQIQEEFDQLNDQEEQNKQQTKSPKKRNQKNAKNQNIKSNKIVLNQAQKINLQEMNQVISKMKKRILEQDQKISKNVKDFKNKDTQITKLKSEVRELLETHEKQISQIKDKYIQQKVQLNIKKSFEVNGLIKELFQQDIAIQKERYSKVLLQNTDMKRRIDELQKQLIDLRQQTKSLSHLYNVKNVELEELAEKNNQDYANYQKKIEDFRIIKNQKETNLINQISLLKDQISTLRIEVKKLNSINSKIEYANFDEALKNQIQSNKTLRQEINKKNEQIYKLRDSYTTVRSQYDNLRSELEVQKLRSISQRKNIQVAYQIQQQNFKNKIAVQEKKTSSLQQKIMLVIEQNKKKDSFIQSYIMGKKLPASQKQFVSQFVKQYEIQMSGKAINQKLKADSHELQKMIIYNYNLLKDMAEMKQKMLLYETLDGQISIYQSKHSGQQRDNDFDFSPTQQKNSQSPKTPNKRFKKMLSLIDPQIQIQKEFSKTPTR